MGRSATTPAAWWASIVERIRPVRVMSIAGGGTSYDIAQGVLYAAGCPSTMALVAQSRGGRSGTRHQHESRRLEPQCGDGERRQAAFINGSLIIASAGNSNNATPQLSRVVSGTGVGCGCRALPARASYSSYGANVDIAAPGGDVSFGATHGVYSSTELPERHSDRGFVAGDVHGRAARAGMAAPCFHVNRASRPHSSRRVSSTIRLTLVHPDGTSSSAPAGEHGEYSRPPQCRRARCSYDL
ncbi:MAG: hypothetical protein IPP90_11440 [Gemmatimonadaceae bacterium]|nr:hypothetical protein [Gemmatimonadaceae bacterium]